MHYWQLQEAKAKLSQLVQLTLKKGPQGISLRGSEEVVMISKKHYENLTGKKPDFITFIFNSPVKNIELELNRDPSLPREELNL